MNDFLKKMKSVFIQEDETAATPGSQPADAKSSAPVEKSQPVAPVPEVTNGSVNNKFLEALAAALEKNNQEGFDYFEFRQALKNLAKMPMDEQTRFQSAFAMAQTMGITSAKLAESTQHYLNVLATEQTKFTEAHAQQRAKLIGNREGEIKSLESAILEKTEQINRLTNEIEAHKKQSEVIRKEISDSTIKIETTKADFETTFASVVGQLQDDLNKIKQYLH